MFTFEYKFFLNSLLKLGLKLAINLLEKLRDENEPSEEKLISGGIIFHFLHKTIFRFSKMADQKIKRNELSRLPGSFRG